MGGCCVDFEADDVTLNADPLIDYHLMSDVVPHYNLASNATTVSEVCNPHT